MDPARAPPKVHASAKPNTVLVSFLGDSTYNSLKPNCLKPFKGPHFDELHSQKTKNKARSRTASATAARRCVSNCQLTDLAYPCVPCFS